MTWSTIDPDGLVGSMIFTLDELFAGRMPKVPLLDRQSGYRRAPRETGAAVQARLL